MSTLLGKKVLLVDDETDVTELLQYKLTNAGLQTHAISDPLQVISVVREFRPDLLVLDIMMPELNGIQICRILKTDPATRHIPVIFLSAKNEPDDRITGLEVGADDYVSKPFEPRELLLRIQALLKRRDNIQRITHNTLITLSGLSLNIEQHQALSNGKHIDLTATEFKLLRLLMERKGTVLSREQLLSDVWQYEGSMETRTVDTHIRRLREKLADKAHLIQTIRGVGYRFMEAL